MDKSFGMGDSAIAQYAFDTFKPLDPILEEIAKMTVDAGIPSIQVGPMDGLHLEVLTRAIGAKKVVEVGTLGGYSGVCIARGLPENGVLYTLEINEDNAKVAAQAFDLAKVSSKVKILLGPALESMKALSARGPFDLVFIDADKQNYSNYLEWAVENIKVGGVILADNTFAFGHIADDSNSGIERPSVHALRTFNESIASNSRLRATILPTGEGLTMAVKVR